MMEHREYMELALKLAAAARGQTSPNPMVGCVLVKNGEVVGMGAHLRAGEAHAEVQALRMAGTKAKGATAYVTLEPCSHYGRTPPCADALIEHGVQTVVVAMLDPNPLVAGRGVAKLKEAGVNVLTGICEAEAKRLNEVFITFITTGRPFVTVKTAMTLDGKVATYSGSSRWITGEEARREVHRMRHEHDAILVGVNTVLADNPQLTTRLSPGGKNPIRVIVDTTLRIPMDANVLTDGQAPTWIFTTEHADRTKRAQLEEKRIRVFSTGDGPKVDIDCLLATLGEQQVSSLLVEGGSQINSAFLHARAINKVVAYVAPKLVAGQNAPTPFGGLGIEEMADAISLMDVSFEKVGNDMKISGYPVWR
ncbi:MULTISPECIES: bifunctional diaminohydroxyphosphoribosylaminopyrimidine deaminase/5-amino-6-(5-phosphoribosylamino)uracil reductase RibD [Aneurinibacillus]|uniref:Riboflavin biosynthesis protein RibD n=1 Tax=Aneurinibacillus thermoaerophilus TaxID=143495 RepID=A0A1G7XMH1_ANETH|nr:MULTISPECIES: bifunctional diaminohydroxyphosphoribosylaminopyrimidine deaminase/5-amino-6-(5-phosphoribosylamino)uracil reductase RibD [Aneurinibacillus]AMA73647.1 bifunctional diaminohydroxyphosphoribosylaminopyrimidine deaminase/5-amino-6-(5-phosphoribosylamino)uracil reductase [Aneurinibacillus sp. XH2]MED0675049.1 bifunctional diaminohydroxyphosphoribosylaminopyrimidine deaminase/5-amino-6-(5-phosphoribosylamino)uracil reductase RibD [Aneurinibacillus thermoaerophilus]MED0679549.1 bifunc